MTKDCRKSFETRDIGSSNQLPIIAVTMAILTSEHEKKSFKLSTHITTLMLNIEYMDWVTYITSYGVFGYINNDMYFFLQRSVEQKLVSYRIH